jgi:ADP-ribosyl-[dinitrogen reductase] hydrolase
MMNEMLKRATNCLYGAAIGDALGGRYEFDQEGLLANDLKTYDDKGKNLLPLLGGGVWRLAPGQVTDDTEMAMALASALIEDPTDVRIAQAYHEWYLSEPFDIGRATKNAVSKTNSKAMKDAALLFDRKCIKEHGEPNLSNGMLMRLAPMGILCSTILGSHDSWQLIQHLVSQDTSLTHGSQEALGYSTAYVVLLAFAIKDGTLQSGIDFLRKNSNIIGDWSHVLAEGLRPGARLAHAPTELIGDVRIAFQLAVRKASMVEAGTMLFSEALISTVSLGGDCDTNCAIVGALCGAVLPLDSKIPKIWTDAISNVIGYDAYDRASQHLPNQLIKQLPQVAELLLEFKTYN